MSQPENSTNQRVVVDTRPIPLVILTKSYRLIAFLAIAAIFWWLIAMPKPAGLSLVGQRSIAIFVVCLILWVTQLLPLAITSLLALALLPFAGVMSSAEAFSLFGNEAVFFILGALILSAALMKSGLSTRIALVFLRRFSGSPRKLLLGILVSSGFMSFWMPEHAVAAIMFPIVLEIANGLELRPVRSSYGKALFISMAWGAIIGGVATFLGGARNPLAIGILKQLTGKTIGFFEWMVAVVPMVVVLWVVAYVIISRYFRIEIDSVEKGVSILEEKNRLMGKLSIEERFIGLIMLGTIVCWVFLGNILGLANIAIAAVVILFIFKLVRWKDVEDYVNWGIILMYGGAIALGFALEKTGAASWVVDSTILKWHLSSLGVILVIAFVSIALTEGISHAAVVAILLPVGISIAKGYHIDPKIMVFAIAVPAGLAFTLPMGNPPNAIAFSSGYVNVRDVFWAGLFITLLAWVVFVLTAHFYWPLINIRL